MTDRALTMLAVACVAVSAACFALAWHLHRETAR